MRTFRMAALGAAALGISGCVNYGDLTGSRSAEQNLAASCRHWDALAASGADADAASVAKECWEDLAIGRQQDEEMQQNLARVLMRNAGQSLGATGEDMGAAAVGASAPPMPPPNPGPPANLSNFGPPPPNFGDRVPYQGYLPNSLPSEQPIINADPYPYPYPSPMRPYGGDPDQ